MMLHYQEMLSLTDNMKSIPERLLSLPSEILYIERDALLQDGPNLQRLLFKEIITRAFGSCYGKAHDIHPDMTLSEWQDIVPITTYVDYAPYVQKELHGESFQLYNNETEMYIATTGSTGKMKLFMESAAGNAAKLLVMAVRGMIMGDLLPVTRDMEAKNLTISNYAQLGTSVDGKPILRASGQTARNLRRKTGTMNILSTQFWMIPNLLPEERDYMMGVYALAERRLSKVFCNNLYAFGRVLKQIDQHAADLIEDIRRGRFSIGKDNVLPKSSFQANFERAQEIENIFQVKGNLLQAPETILALWPNCQMVSCWLSGSVGRDAREVLRYMPANVQCFDMGYGASEGKFSVPTKLACASGVAAPFSVFFEFQPLDRKERPLYMWEVQDGEYYELIVTTYSGLYRYNMLDVVHIEGFFGATPNIVFCGKSTEWVLVGQKKIYGFEISDLFYEIERRRKVHFDVVQAYTEDEALYYVLSSEDVVDYRELKGALDRYSLFHWGVQSSGICVMKKSYKPSMFNERVRIDRGACGIKLPVILSESPEKEHIALIVKEA